MAHRARQHPERAEPASFDVSPIQAGSPAFRSSMGTVRHTSISGGGKPRTKPAWRLDPGAPNCSSPRTSSIVTRNRSQVTSTTTFASTKARSVLVAHTTHGGNDVRHRLAGQRLAPTVREPDHVGLRAPDDDLRVLRLLLGKFLKLRSQPVLGRHGLSLSNSLPSSGRARYSEESAVRPDLDVSPAHASSGPNSTQGPRHRSWTR
jgi:hypothetical protein